MRIRRLVAEDRAAWERLFRGYIDFYGRDEPDAMYERAWRVLMDGDEFSGFGAETDAGLVGITHYLEHASTSSANVCYLQDLFVDPEARGLGVARALIAAVEQDARDRHCVRLYWATQRTNTVARALYDKVASDAGFMIYRVPLAPVGTVD